MIHFLKLTLLSSLIAAPGLCYSVENMLTCFGDIHRLSCDFGRILVKSSVLGRTDTSVCTYNRSPSEVGTSSCSLQSSTVGNRCNGLIECELRTDLLGDPDPCIGIYKYYNTIYDCISARFVVVCEQGYTTLDCGNDYVYIINANFGRDNSRLCSSGMPSDWTQNINCYAPNTFQTVSTLCNGQKKCTVQASAAVFTDPCVGTVKYLSVSYICSKEIVACQGKTASVNCGSQRIMIISANYGRTDSITCSCSGQPPSVFQNTNCYTADTLDKVKTRCEGLNSCQVPANNDIFSNPCSDTYKYLKITYSCL